MPVAMLFVLSGIAEDGHGSIAAVDADDAASGVRACSAQVETLHGSAGRKAV